MLRAVLRTCAVLVCTSIAGAGCVDARSDAYTCASDADCDADRTCRAGWCTTTGADGEPARRSFECPDYESCAEPIACGAGGPCTVMCDGERSCSAPITCAPGRPCTILCAGKESCRGGIDCSAASHCEITCSGDKACDDRDQLILCGSATAACAVDCSGKDSCRGNVDCADACACDISCTGGGMHACEPAPLCPPGCDAADGPGCDSTLPGCGICG